MWSIRKVPCALAAEQAKGKKAKSNRSGRKRKKRVEEKGKKESGKKKQIIRSLSWPKAALLEEGESSQTPPPTTQI